MSRVKCSRCGEEATEKIAHTLEGYTHLGCIGGAWQAIKMRGDPTPFLGQYHQAMQNQVYAQVQTSGTSLQAANNLARQPRDSVAAEINLARDQLKQLRLESLHRGPYDGDVDLAERVRQHQAIASEKLEAQGESESEQSPSHQFATMKARIAQLEEERGALESRADFIKGERDAYYRRITHLEAQGVESAFKDVKEAMGHLRARLENAKNIIAGNERTIEALRQLDDAHELQVEAARIASSRANVLSDACGALKTENTELLAENARLRRGR